MARSEIKGFRSKSDDFIFCWRKQNKSPLESMSIESPDVVALVQKMLIYKSKLRFFGLRAPNHKPL